ncbi:MAG: potassium transporter Kup [Caulobacteraceae bacterium]|nr:potassium transporter Kup [Caulobacteraceae bacterium]
MTGEAKLAADPKTSPAPAPPSATQNAPAAPHAPAPNAFWAMALGSAGVVFGDIGTSPLYAFKLALAQATDKGVVHVDAVMGVVSLALWALFLVVTVKYVLFLMRADNRGEGGVLSLMALAQEAIGRRTLVLFALGGAGAALFYGDAVITPAISVLSAVEGLKTVPVMGPMVTLSWVLILSLVILIGLFMVQSRGTAKVAVFFGPICVVWFAAIAGIGLMHMPHDPEVLLAISPSYAVVFLAHHGVVGLFVLGSVFLTVTGAEALYADMGHFGRWPIQAAWLFLVLPCLVLNYLGQGAFALQTIRAAHGGAVGDVDWFFQMTPALLRVPMVILATAATVIASQAVITGAYSLTNQAMQLGLLPRMVVRRTSETQAGQIYLPQINTMLLIGVIVLIAVFKSSDSLGNAYGLAVTGTMAVTTSLAFIVVYRGWKWPLLGAAAMISPLLTLDMVFLGANALKLLHGAALPLILGAALFGVMATWVRGTDIVNAKLQRDTPLLDDFLPLLAARPPHRVAGTAIYLTGDPTHAPGALLHNLKHNKVLHERNVILNVETLETPRVDEAERVKVTPLNDDFMRVTIKYGFMETPNVPKALIACRKQGLGIDMMSTSFFLGRKTMVSTAKGGVWRWRDRLFLILSKNAANPTEFFHIPPGRVLEMGAQVTV